MNIVFRVMKWGVALLVLAVLAIGTALYLVDLNDLKPQIIGAVKDTTGRDLALEGDLSWSLYPNIGVNMGRASLSNPEGFSSPTFAKVDGLSVRVRLLPLLSKKIQIAGVDLEGVNLNLEVNKNGTSNWADLNTPSGQKTQKTTPQKEAKSFDLKSIKLSGLSIKNALITYKDQVKNQAYTVSDFGLNVGAIDWASPVMIDGQLNAVDEKAGTAATIKYGTTVGMNAEKQIFDFNQLKLNIVATGKTLPNQKVTVALNTNAKVNVLDEHVQLNNMSLNLDDAQVKGSASVKGFKQPNVMFDLAVGNINLDKYSSASKSKDTQKTSSKNSDKIELPLDVLRTLTLNGQLTLARVQSGDVVITNGTIKTTAKNGKLSIAPLQWTMFDAPFSATATLDVTGKVPAYAVSANLQSLQLKPVLSQFAQYEDLDGTATVELSATTSGERVSQLMNRLSGTLKNLAVNGVLSSANFPNPVQLNLGAKAHVNGEQVTLDALTVKFDESTLTGNAHVVGFSQPAIQFTVNVDKVNLDDYLSGNESTSNKKKSSKSTGNEDLGLPVDLIRKLNLSGQLGVGSLQVMNVKTANMNATLKAENGLVTLNPLSMDMYQGTFNGLAEIDARKDTPSFKMRTTLKQLNVNPMLVDVADLSYLEGLGGVQFNVSTSGQTVNQLKQSLNGDWDLSLAKGAFKSNLLQDLGDLLSLTNANVSSTLKNGETTPFKTLSGLGAIRNGVISTNNVSFNVEGIDFNTVGRLNINDGELNVGLKLKKDDISCEIPIKGNISGLNYKSFVKQALPGCLASAGKQRAEKEVQQKLDKEKDKLKTKVEDKLKDKLGDKLGTDALKNENGDTPEDIGKALEDKAKEKMKKELLKGLFGD